jgi:hypothetical protein
MRGTAWMVSHTVMPADCRGCPNAVGDKMPAPLPLTEQDSRDKGVESQSVARLSGAMEVR